MPVITQVLGELLVEGGFDHCVGDRIEQPIRAGQRHPGIASLAHQFAGDFQLVDIATYRDCDRRRSGIGISVLQ
jgi:hypothetical protein